MNKDLREIQELDKKDIAASIAQDYESLLELWDEDCIAIPPGKDPVIGIYQIKRWLNQSDEIDYEVTKYEHNFVERKIIGDWAFEWGTSISAAVPQDDGPPVESSGKLLRILKRQPDGEWKVLRATWNIDRKKEYLVSVL